MHVAICLVLCRAHEYLIHHQNDEEEEEEELQPWGRAGVNRVYVRRTSLAVHQNEDYHAR